MTTGGTSITGTGINGTGFRAAEAGNAEVETGHSA